MKSRNGTHSFSNLVREKILFRKNDQDIKQLSENKHVKETRKVSIVSVLDNQKIKNRKGKCRLSLAPTSEEKFEAGNFSRQYNFKSNNDDHVSTIEEPQIECKNNDHQLAESLSKLKIDNNNNNNNENLQENKDNSSRKNEHIEENINETDGEELNLSEDTNPKDISLEEKLADNREMEILGIMNLSSMNITDHDMILIIQRAFYDYKSKCIGLILRNNDLTSIGVKMLVDTLISSRTKLKYLSFSNNPNIGDKGVEYLTNLLQKNRSLTFLALPNTGMTDYGVRLLADVLCGVNDDSTCPPLEKLHISFNKLITDQSIEALIQIIEQNQTLKLLSLQYCSLSDKVRRKLRKAVTKKKKKFSLSE
ncbi:unnamed protein product [Rotaria sp. Silwood2]|nr:unnamed protein product [Rotaria sp. Silwood2]CAF4470238.1 unnamed protein product [Rotaria sp. Silwood2]